MIAVECLQDVAIMEVLSEPPFLYTCGTFVPYNYRVNALLYIIPIMLII
jgi:hypothetical protein